MHLKRLHALVAVFYYYFFCLYSRIVLNINHKNYTFPDFRTSMKKKKYFQEKSKILFLKNLILKLTKILATKENK